MAWVQLKFFTKQNTVDAISDLLMELSALSITYEDAEDNPILEPLPGQTPLWDELNVTALFEGDCDTDLVLQQIQASNFANDLVGARFEQLEDKDWIREWMDSFKPMQFGERVWIVPSWHEPVDPSAVNILLDPGLAFGTGTHPTTSLCLQWLDQNDVANSNVLDYGCGSGILAIAAVKLGAKQCVAIDIDPQAITATKDNMQRNHLSPESIAVGQPSIADNQEYDLVMANILAGPLKQLAESIAEKVKVGGQLVLSGLLKEQAQEISNHYEKWFNMAPAVTCEDWVRLNGVKKESLG